jgi:homocysteine S-methyltransferase
MSTRRNTAPAHPFAPFVAARGLVVVDGALATELEARGADLADPLWSARVLLEQPALIAQVHADYFAAGADIAIAATYQATVQGFASRGLDRVAAEGLMRGAVAMAREARDAFWADPGHRIGRARPLVAASVGPYGAFLADGSEYRGDYPLNEDALVAWHHDRFALLTHSGADLLACETIPCAAEARALLRLLDEHPQARAWLTFSARDDVHLSSGERFDDIAAVVGAHPQVIAVGINCTAPAHVAPLICAARAVTDTPIIVYPNAGETFDPVTKRWAPTAACVPFVDSARAWQLAGAMAIGGCCRTTPSDIAALVRAMAPT